MFSVSVPVFPVAIIVFEPNVRAADPGKAELNAGHISNRVRPIPAPFNAMLPTAEAGIVIAVSITKSSALNSTNVAVPAGEIALITS